MRILRTASFVAFPFALTAVVAQAPRFGQVGDPFPDGMGQLAGVADYEGDGDIDVFTHVGVFLNTNGHFVAGPQMPNFGPLQNTYEFAVADFTGDGRVDVLIARAGGTPAGLVLYVAPPVGGGTFTVAPAAFSGAQLMHRFDVLDCDGDGDVDVCAAATSIATPSWLLFVNNGAGAFTAASASQWPPVSMAASWVGAGDFDGDGSTDVFASGPSGDVWRRNLGGSFGPAVAIGTTLLADRAAVGDFDADGDDDVLAIAVSGDEIVFAGTPVGPVAGVAAFGGVLGPPPLAADVNGDGFVDVLRTHVGVSGNVVGDLYLRSGGPAGLSAPLSLGPVAFAHGNPMPFRGIAALDVENDGDPDLAFVTGNRAPGLLINGVSGPRFAEQAIPFGFGDLFAPPHDVDGDGDLDLVRASLANGVVSLEVARNDGRGGFANPVQAGAYPGLMARAIWSDLDADGDADLWATVWAQPPSGIALLNNGTGVFSAFTTVGYPGLTPVTSVAVADLDGNGVPDIVVGRGMTFVFPFPPTFQQPRVIFGFSNAGSLSYSLAPTGFGVAEMVLEIVPTDADSDGDLDLLVATAANGAPGEPRLYANDGAGGFTAQSPFPGAIARSVATGDLNGDTLLDLVLGAQVWTNTGTGFAVTSSHAAPLGLLSLADVDVDGDLDLVDSAGLWYEGSAGAGFAAPTNIVPYAPVPVLQPLPWKTEVADFDADGDPDLIGPGAPAVYANLTRHAGRAGLVVPNAPLALAIHGAPGDSWVLAASLPGTPPLPLPPLGTLFLDPASLLILGGGVIPANGRFDFAGGAMPPLHGFTFAWQALVGPMLSNGFSTFIP